MNYFVFIENTNYFLWQIDILIQSFKNLNIIDKLVICVKDNDQSKISAFGQNVKLCKTLLRTNDKFSGLYLAIKNNLLSQPFTLLEPDSILLNPLPITNKNVIFSIQKGNHNLIQHYIDNILNAKKLSFLDFYQYIGDTISLNTLPIEFFTRILEWQNILKDTNTNNPLILTLIEYYGHISIIGTHNYESQLYNNDVNVNNVVRYNKDFYPHFSKCMFKYEPPDFFSLGNVFEVLSNCNLTTTTNSIQPVVQSLRPSLATSSMIF